MAAKKLFSFRTKFDSANTWFIRELLYRNMIWLLGSLQLLLCSYVVCLFAIAINFVARFLVGGDGKAERCCEIDGFREEVTNFLFQCHENVFEEFGIGEEKTESSSVMEAISDVDQEKKKIEGGALLMEVYSAIQKDNEKEEGETESSVSMEGCSDNDEDENKSEGELDCCVSMKVHSDSHEIKEKKAETERFVPEVHCDETEKFVSQKVQFGSPEDGNKKETKSESSISMNVHCDLPESKKEGETGSLVSTGDHSDSHENEEKKQGKSSVLMEAQSQHKGEGETSCVLMEANSATTAQKHQYVSGRDVSGFMEEPTSMRFTFQEFFVGPNEPVIFYNNAEIISQKQGSSEHPKEGDDEEEAESTQENEFLGCNNSQNGIKAVIFMAAGEDRAEESGKERSNQEPENKHGEKAEEWKKMMEELENEVGNEWRMEWDHDDIVEQLKIDLRNARQGGLSTIIEEQEEEEDEEEEEEEREGETGETEHAEEAGHQKLQNNDENEELKDEMAEVEEVYQTYEDKMRKLDILNYQTMHGLGLLQLKDYEKSSFKGLKPLISQNLWPRKEAKTPLMKLVQELQKDLEVAYVGQVCLSWEILCWLHMKALPLKQHYYHSQADHHPPHFNVAAGEFQLFQVLLQRFIENEAFQGPRTLNFVKNRCVIRNLLQVPPIRDDGAEEKNITKGGEEEFVVSIARLAEIIKESMWLFWRFVRAEKEDGNLILKVSRQTRTDPKDPAISDLVKDIRAHLHKKEKKLKDLVKTGNCIVRKFKKHQQQQEDQLNLEQLLAKVELKLVSRVLNLSKLRKEHLIWCKEKLRRIKFVMKKKKVVVEPSFMLFPC